MRKAAPYLLVRERKCAMVRRNSSEWRFFWSGKVSGSARPNTVISLARTSHFWPLPGDSTSSPVTATHAPVLTPSSLSHAAVPSSTIHWMLPRQEPSLSSRNEKPLASRRVRTHPPIRISDAADAAPSASATGVRSIEPPQIICYFLIFARMNSITTGRTETMMMP